MIAVNWYNQGDKSEIFQSTPTMSVQRTNTVQLFIMIHQKFHKQMYWSLKKHLILLIVINFMETLWEVTRLFGPWGNHNQGTKKECFLVIKMIIITELYRGSALEFLCVFGSQSFPGRSDPILKQFLCFCCFHDC